MRSGCLFSSSLMIIMNLNCRGLASNPKKLDVRRLNDEHGVDVLFMQETMGTVFILVDELQTMLKE